jgi:hypothetical protein
MFHCFTFCAFNVYSFTQSRINWNQISELCVHSSALGAGSPKEIWQHKSWDFPFFQSWVNSLCAWIHALLCSVSRSLYWTLERFHFSEAEWNIDFRIFWHCYSHLLHSTDLLNNRHAINKYIHYKMVYECFINIWKTSLPVFHRINSTNTIHQKQKQTQRICTWRFFPKFLFCSIRPSIIEYSLLLHTLCRATLVYPTTKKQ